MNGRFYSASEYYKAVFGEKVYRLSLCLGVTCPNRDGTKDTRGCIFCSEGSSHFAESGNDIKTQIENAKLRIQSKTDAKKFIAYFQSYTTTYLPACILRKALFEAIMMPEIVALSIATRPDCLPDKVLSLLSELNEIKPVFVELGLQTANENSAEYIRRCYTNDVFEDAVRKLKECRINVITHIIIGLPEEGENDILNTVRFAVKSGTDGIKLQLLHILKGTELYQDYLLDKVIPLTLTEYTDLVCKCIEIIPENIVIHRITGDAPKSLLAEPKWSGDKKTVLNTINRELKNRNITQGCALK
ncbi:MAG: TIGR01212 family radical SAM protein [Oscillospiraceae bacterium]|nr:TIGR01212 family radical SAM protein [Oscillospiraceae bacterium]